jgi:hypothetical protein
MGPVGGADWLGPLVKSAPAVARPLTIVSAPLLGEHANARVNPIAAMGTICRLIECIVFILEFS